jgi:cytochrome c-type biogenesis protein CcmH/NrfF
LPQHLRQWNLKLVTAFAAVLALSFIPASVAQDPLTSPVVMRVGQRLACRCGGCRNSVATCPMIHCEFGDPMRQRILKMAQAGMSDDQIVNTIVREDGIVALASPPGSGWGLFTWVMPGIALVIGFFVYSVYVRRHRKAPEHVTAGEQAVLDRFSSQIEHELGEDSEVPRK